MLGRTDLRLEVPTRRPWSGDSGDDDQGVFERPAERLEPSEENRASASRNKQHGVMGEADLSPGAGHRLRRGGWPPGCTRSGARADEPASATI